MTEPASTRTAQNASSQSARTTGSQSANLIYLFGGLRIANGRIEEAKYADHHRRTCVETVVDWVPLSEVGSSAAK